MPVFVPPDSYDKHRRFLPPLLPVHRNLGRRPGRVLEVLGHHLGIENPEQLIVLDLLLDLRQDGFGRPFVLVDQHDADLRVPADPLEQVGLGDDRGFAGAAGHLELPDMRGIQGFHPSPAFHDLAEERWAGSVIGTREPYLQMVCAKK
jgi:hypothetical protein